MRTKPHIYTEEEKQFLKDNVKGINSYELTELFNSHFNLNLTHSQIKGAMSRYKLTNGLVYRIPKGNVPHNKGVKGVCSEGCKKTWFKKGNTPLNHRPVGSERVNVDGYVEIKVSDPNKWRLKQQLIWEEHNGPVPKGYAVIFGDGNKLNLDIDNLILVSRKKLLVMNRNNLIKENTDLTRTGTIIADVLIKINERKAK